MNYTQEQMKKIKGIKRLINSYEIDIECIEKEQAKLDIEISRINKKIYQEHEKLSKIDEQVRKKCKHSHIRPVKCFRDDCSRGGYHQTCSDCGTRIN